MIAIEAEATVTPDGRITMDTTAPSNCPVGVHRIRIEVLEARPPFDREAALKRMPVPKEYFKGRPVYDEEDLRHMLPHLPPEDDWAREHGIQ